MKTAGMSAVIILLYLAAAFFMPGCKAQTAAEESGSIAVEEVLLKAEEIKKNQERRALLEQVAAIIEKMESEKIEEEAIIIAEVAAILERIELKEIAAMEKAAEAEMFEEEAEETVLDLDIEVEAEEGAEETMEMAKGVITEEKSGSQSEEPNGLSPILGNINILSGYELSAEVQNGRPLAVMVQNAPNARPQSGLIYADIVMETVVEYGITRFVAFFSSKDAPIIGPVRSARIYYAELARSFDPIYSFWGTYHDAYGIIASMDMDIFDAHNRSYVPHTSAGWRDPSRNTTIEHTAFIDTYGIKKDSERIGYSLEGGQSPLLFKVDADASNRGDISEITVNFSSQSFKAGFTYEEGTNKYLRSMAGEPHVDFETGQQIAVNNVVVLITDIEGPFSSAGHMMVRTTGSHEEGKAYYFIDGHAIEGSWARNSILEPFEFRNAHNEPILFNRGATWICMVHSLDRLLF